MKNKNIINIAVLLFLGVLIIVFSRSNVSSIDNNIYNKKWYHYNHISGYYDSIYFENEKITYNKPMNINTSSSYDNCKKYKYNSKSNLLSLDCGKIIKIIEIKDNKMILEIDDRTTIFFDNIEDTLNYEFETYYGKSIVEFKKEKSQAKDFIKINSKKLVELINNKDYSKIVFTGNKCTSVDCTIGLDILEKWISTTENVYYIDVDDLDKDTLNKLNKVDSELDNNINYYNDIYPLVLIFKEGKLIDHYYINCDGFNCNKYYKNEFN